MRSHLTAGTFRPLLQAGVACLVLLGLADRALASVFSVTPTRLVLTTDQKSALLTVSNDSDRAVRFQLSIFTWDQNDDGSMKLGPTSDIVFYPPLLTLAAKETRQIRVGTQIRPAAVERSYRLFVEELPNADEAPSSANAVKMRTRIGIPVFVQGAKPAPAPKIERVAAEDGAVNFDVRNLGNTHTVVQTVQIRGLSAAGREQFTTSATGWYLLAQQRQVFRVAIDPAQCGLATRLVVTVTTDDGLVSTTVEMPRGACVR